MNRHLRGAYTLAAGELLLGAPMTLGAWRLGALVSRQPNTRPDDVLAAAGLALAGVALLISASVTMLHAFVPYGIVRGARIAAGILDLGTILAGAGIIVAGRRHGGDWAGFTILGGSVFLAAGVLLFLFSIYGLRYLRRLRG